MPLPFMSTLLTGAGNDPPPTPIHKDTNTYHFNLQFCSQQSRQVIESNVKLLILDEF